MSKALDEMSSSELFELAQRRKQEEKMRLREAHKEQVEGLRAKRRELTARYKKDLAAVDAEIKTLDLPAEQARRLRDLRKGAEAKFQATLAKLGHLNEKTHWLHLETAAPQCVPADPAGARADLLLYTRGTVLLETAGKNDWLQTGPMIQVGAAWRLTDAPGIGADGDGPGAGTAVADNPELQKLLKQLGELDGDYAKKQGTADVARYNLDRTTLIEKIIALVKPEEREQWLRQAADCLSAAAQASPASDRAASERLAGLVTQMEKALPAGHALLAYVTFRQMQADYTLQISDPKVKDFAKVQTDWLDRLAKFVKTYPTADDAPDALLSLGWVSEMVGKEIEAKNWYGQLAKDFADKPQAAKAKGALRRIDLEGSVLELVGPTLDGGAYDLASLKGKTVIVYYWASWNNQSVGDFAKLKLLLDTYGPKGVELVTVNLDNTAEEATAFIRKVSAPGTHLYTPGGMESKLATSYGVMMLPNLFLVNKDGKVANRTAQVANLEDELKKLTK